MSPSSLNGLNIVHTQQQTPYLSDSQDLLNVPHFPDLNAQLDLWSNLTFESDEPLGNDFGSRSQDDERDDDSDHEGPARLDAHENVVNAIPLPNPAPTSAPPALGPDSSLDLNTILSAFGIDPYLVPSVTASQPPAQMASASLAQLLSSYPNAPESFMPLPHLQQLTTPVSQMQAQSIPPPAASEAPATAQKRAESPSVKRAWNRKSSTSTASTSTSPASQPGSSESKSELANGDAAPAPVLSAAEDKRRRNTAASARFRLKKKEREVALERKSKELETRVSELERECETLRRENGWLKGLVVGVTGVGAGSTPPSPGTFPSVSMVGMKRRREESGDTKPVMASS